MARKSKKTTEVIEPIVDELVKTQEITGAEDSIEPIVDELEQVQEEQKTETKSKVYMSLSDFLF